jgi:glyoxylase-like metal-dependent hydrolase (beta-lactamase superfamily II)
MSQTDPYRIHALELGPMENFIYLVEDRATGRAAVVDPAWDVPAILQLARERGVRITDVLLTHSHHDHINGLEALLATADAQLHLLKPEARFWGAELDLPTLHHGGDIIQLGETAIEVLHTPGHTPGSACYRMGDDVITGDTLFVFGCGRCDLRGGDPEQMYQTLRRMTRELPGRALIHPGHNYAEKPCSTLEEQEEGNPFLHFDQLDRFIEYRMHYHDRHRDSPYGPVPRGQEMP